MWVILATVWAAFVHTLKLHASHYSMSKQVTHSAFRLPCMVFQLLPGQTKWTLACTFWVFGSLSHQLQATVVMQTQEEFGCRKDISLTRLDAKEQRILTHPVRSLHLYCPSVLMQSRPPVNLKPQLIPPKWSNDLRLGYADSQPNGWAVRKITF